MFCVYAEEYIILNSVIGIIDDNSIFYLISDLTNTWECFAIYLKIHKNQLSI